MTHPAQTEATRRYRVACAVWASNQAIRDAATLLSMTERAYCEAYVSMNYGALTWTGSASVEPEPLDLERAYREARCQV